MRVRSKNLQHRFFCVVTRTVSNQFRFIPDKETAMSNDYETGFKDNHNEEEVKMNCDTVWDLLSVYADGEATPEGAAMVESHIAACADCARDLAFMQSAQAALIGVPEVEPPATLQAAILAATVNRPTFPQRMADAVRRTLAPAPVRYGAIAAAGAAAAITFAALKNENGGLPNPVEYHPARPSIIANKPNTTDLFRSNPPGTDRMNILPIPSVKKPDVHKEHPAYVYAYNPNNGRRRRVRILEAALNKPLTTAPGRAAPDYKAKFPTVAPSLDDDIRDETPETVASNATTTESNVKPAVETTTSEATATKESAPNQPVRIQLIAAANPVGAGQMATLADIRRSLRNRNGALSSRELRESLKDKEIRVDVIRGSF
jgi:hypothetical protein